MAGKYVAATAIRYGKGAEGIVSLEEGDVVNPKAFPKEILEDLLESGAVVTEKQYDEAHEEPEPEPEAEEAEGE